MSLQAPPLPDEQYEELIEYVFALERSSPPPWSWLRAVQAGRHVCALPQGQPAYYGQVFECPCGLHWQRELSGGWLPQKS